MDQALGHQPTAPQPALVTGRRQERKHRNWTALIDSGEKVATILVPAIVSFATLVGGLWLTNRDQTKDIDGLRDDVAKWTAATDKRFDRVDRTTDDIREELRDVRNEVSRIRRPPASP